MNKKVLVIAVALMAVAMLATPMVGLVQAGKGQTKQYFKLYMEGMLDYSVLPERLWYSDDVIHARGGPWIVTGAFYVLIGEGGSVETIAKAYLSYSGLLDINLNTKTLEATLKVRETITIWADTGHTTLRGTLEILSVDKIYNYLTPEMYGIGTFVGHGTGEFEGVKVEGTTSTEAGPPVIREGTVMGWP